MKCCQLIQQCQLDAEHRIFGDNCAAEFRGISQIAPQNLAKFVAENGGPAESVYVLLRNAVTHARKSVASAQEKMESRSFKEVGDLRVKKCVQLVCASLILLVRLTFRD